MTKDMESFENTHSGDNWSGPKLILLGAVVLGLALAVILALAYSTPQQS